MKILSVFYDSLNTTDLNDPEVFIKIDISNVCHSTCRVLTLDISVDGLLTPILVAKNGTMILTPERPRLISLVTFATCALTMSVYCT